MHQDDNSAPDRERRELLVFDRDNPGAEYCSSVQGMRYARGFYFGSEEWQHAPQHWRSAKFGGGWLYWDSRVAAAFCSDEAASVALVGRVIDLEEDSGDLGAICVALLKARRSSRSAMQALVDRLCGRFVLIDQAEGELSLQQDAAGMRTVYYLHEGARWYVAAHARLINDIAGGLEASFFGDHWRDKEPHVLSGAYGYPGRMSAFKDVFALTPNTVLNVQRGTVERIFPLCPPREISACEVGGQLARFFAKQLRILAADSGLVFSLTSGLDSRVTLAAAEGIAKDGARFFTYTPPTHQRDVDVALQLTRELGLDHRLIDLADFTDIPPGFMGAMRANCPRRHISRAALAYMRIYSQDALHVRSNHYEIGRAFFLKHRPTKPRMDIEIMQKRLLEKGGEGHPAILAAFSDWVEFTRFPFESGYLPQDLFYWEHRMSRWCAENLCESDVAFDTWAVVNSRLLYKLMLAVPFEERLHGTAYLNVIREMWPDLLRYPINNVIYS